MLSIDDFLKKSKSRVKIHKNYGGKADIFSLLTPLDLLKIET